MPCRQLDPTAALGGADVGPHFNQSGELWWYLGVLDVIGTGDDIDTSNGETVGIQYSVFRQAGDKDCTNASIDSKTMSTLAVSHNGNYYPLTRIDMNLDHANFRSDPYSLRRSESPSWGVWQPSSAAPTRQKLFASSSNRTAHPLEVSLELDVPEANILMGVNGYAHLPNPHAADAILGHISKPRISARGTVRVNHDRTLAVRGEMWLQHIWWSAVPGGAGFPGWNWFNVQLSHGWDLQIMSLGNGTRAMHAGGCLGERGSYANLIAPPTRTSPPEEEEEEEEEKGVSGGRRGVPPPPPRKVTPLDLSQFCVKVQRTWTDPRCPWVHYPVVSHIAIKEDAATQREALSLTVTVMVNESVVRLPFAGLAPCALSYFEAASLSNGTHGRMSVTGRGFTEHHGCDTLNIAIMDEGALQAFEAVSMHGDPDLDVASGRFLWRLWRDPGVRSCWDQWEANPHLLREVSPQVDANTPMLMSQCRDTIFHDEPPAASSGGAEQAPRGLDPSTALLSYVHTGDAPQVCLRWPRSMAAGKALEVKLKDYGLSHSTALSGDDGAPLDVVCFVAALSDFDCPPQLGLGVRSRLVEALNTFEDCCEHMVREGLDAPLLVVLNKIDLFARWIVQPGRTLDSAWPEYTGGADASAATAFVRLQFENVHARCRPAARPLRIVCCNALDRESVADKLWPELVDMLPIDPAAVASAATRGEDQEGGDQRIAPGRAQSTTSLRLPRMRSRSTSSSSGRPSSAGGSSLMSSMRAAMGRMGM